jgi:hypothetical protein
MPATRSSMNSPRRGARLVEGRRASRVLAATVARCGPACEEFPSLPEPLATGQASVRASCAPQTARYIRDMPLFARLRDDHYPDDERSPRLDYYVVLSGGLEVGGFHRIGSGPSEGKWSWGAEIGSGNATFAAGGYATHPDVCRTLIDLSFRRMLARADLRERPDAKPGPPRRASAEGIAITSGPAPPYEREKDRPLGPMVRNELRRTIRSGELVVGPRDAWPRTLVVVLPPHAP